MRLDPTVFRQEAIDAYLGGERAAGIVRTAPPWTWAVLAGVAAFAAAGLAAALLVETEVTSRGRGIVLPVGGVRVLTAQVGGTVAEVFVRSGDRVEHGAPILRLESAPVQAQLLDAERNLQLIESEFLPRTEQHERSLAQEQALLAGRLVVLRQQIASLEHSAHVFERRVAANLELASQGLVSRLNVDEAREALAQSQRQLLAARLQLAQAQEEGVALATRKVELVWEREREHRRAQDRRDTLAFSRAQTVVHAPQAGVVEAILLSPGAAVQPAQVVGRLIPGEPALQLVAFIPEGDRAFVREGDSVRLELDQRPYLEFGTVVGRIRRIAADIASPNEVMEALGPQIRVEGACYRIEAEVLSDSASRLGLSLRSGMLAHVRYTLRRQRVISLLLGPLRRAVE